MQEEDKEGIVCLLPNWLLFVEFKKNEGLISENEIHIFLKSFFFQMIKNTFCTFEDFEWLSDN